MCRFQLPFFFGAESPLVKRVRNLPRLVFQRLLFLPSSAQTSEILKKRLTGANFDPNVMHEQWFWCLNECVPVEFPSWPVRHRNTLWDTVSVTLTSLWYFQVKRLSDLLFHESVTFCSHLRASPATSYTFKGSGTAYYLACSRLLSDVRPRLCLPL